MHVESAQVVSEEELRATQEGYADPVSGHIELESPCRPKILLKVG
jgi:hypothetical protein